MPVSLLSANATVSALPCVPLHLNVSRCLFFVFVLKVCTWIKVLLYFQTLFPGAKRVFAPLRLYVEVYNAKLHQTL